MSSLRKISANRKNGKRGGPKTPEGKLKCGLNALKHGLSGNTLLLNSESRPMYNALLDSFVERFQPADTVELELLVEMVNARWRLRRACGIEAALVDLQINEQGSYVTHQYGDVDDTVRVAIAFRGLAERRGLELLGRYEGRNRKQFERALAELRRLQAERKAKQANDDPAPAPKPPQKRQTNPPAPAIIRPATPVSAVKTAPKPDSRTSQTKPKPTSPPQPPVEPHTPDPLR